MSARGGGKGVCVSAVVFVFPHATYEEAMPVTMAAFSAAPTSDAEIPVMLKLVDHTT